MKFYRKKIAILVFIIMAILIYFRVNSPSTNKVYSDHVQLFTDPNDFDLAYQANGMISAIGYDNSGNQIKGWVYARALENHEPNNPTEAVIRQKVRDVLDSYTDDKTINLYSNDGTTIIGKFDID